MNMRIRPETSASAAPEESDLLMPQAKIVLISQSHINQLFLFYGRKLSLKYDFRSGMKITILLV